VVRSVGKKSCGYDICVLLRWSIDVGRFGGPIHSDLLTYEIKFGVSYIKEMIKDWFLFESCNVTNTALVHCLWLLHVTFHMEKFLSAPLKYCVELHSLLIGFFFLEFLCGILCHDNIPFFPCS